VYGVPAATDCPIINGLGVAQGQRALGIQLRHKWGGPVMLPWIFGLAAVFVFLLFNVSALACLLQHWSLSSRGVEATDVTIPLVPPRQQQGYLSEEDRDNFSHLWSSIQERFGEDAETAVLYADMLLFDLMQEYSWDLEDRRQERDQRKSNYRAAHATATCVRQGHVARGELQQAMEIYSVLFNEILGGTETVAPSERRAA
jgi:hypothetical protein